MAKAKGDYIGWLRLDGKGWLAVCKADTLPSCEELLAKYKSVRGLENEAVVLPRGTDPHPGHSTFKP